ncbi:MAG: hypothetical protein AB7V43_11450 [Acidimicrobiia bacterium]
MAWFLPSWLPDGTTLMNVGWGIHDTDVLQYRVSDKTRLDIYQSRDGVRSLLFDGYRGSEWTAQLGPRTVLVGQAKGGPDGWFAYAPDPPHPEPPAFPDTHRFSFTQDGTWLGVRCSGDPLPDEELRRIVANVRLVTFDDYTAGIAPFVRPEPQEDEDIHTIPGAKLDPPEG